MKNLFTKYLQEINEKSSSGFLKYILYYLNELSQHCSARPNKLWPLFVKADHFITIMSQYCHNNVTLMAFIIGLQSKYYCERDVRTFDKITEEQFTAFPLDL